MVARAIKWTPTSAAAVLMALILFATPPSARASLIIEVQNVGANSPSSADALDITLFNTGPLSVTLGGFSFEISVTDSAIAFTSATIATVSAPYVFAGHSLFGPTISTSAPGQTLDAADAYDIPSAGPTIGAGVTVGLGHVVFNVAAGDTPGPKTVTLAAFPATELSDPNGNGLAFNLVNGTITITASSRVPQASTILLMLTGLASLMFARCRRTSDGREECRF